MNVKFFLIFCLIFIISNITFSQELKEVKLISHEKKQGIAYKYEFSEHDAYGVVSLLLFDNKTYQFFVKKFDGDGFNIGKWVMHGDTLSLKSDILPDSIPLKLEYMNDTVGLGHHFRVNIVKNLQDQQMTDAFVFINSDTIRCLPFAERCLGNYESIDSIKVVLENGLSSRWVRVFNNNSCRIAPIIETNYILSKYIPFGTRQYLISKSILKQVCCDN